MHMPNPIYFFGFYIPRNRISSWNTANNPRKKKTDPSNVEDILLCFLDVLKRAQRRWFLLARFTASICNLFAGQGNEQKIFFFSVDSF